MDAVSSGRPPHRSLRRAQQFRAAVEQVGDPGFVLVGELGQHLGVVEYALQLRLGPVQPGGQGFRERLDVAAVDAAGQFGEVHQEIGQRQRTAGLLRFDHATAAQERRLVVGGLQVEVLDAQRGVHADQRPGGGRYPHSRIQRQLEPDTGLVLEADVRDRAHPDSPVGHLGGRGQPGGIRHAHGHSDRRGQRLRAEHGLGHVHPAPHGDDGEQHQLDDNSSFHRVPPDRRPPTSPGGVRSTGGGFR